MDLKHRTDMIKYIDADKLKAEIKRRQEQSRKMIGGQSRVQLCRQLLDFITSLQQEQPEVDLKPLDYIIKTNENEFVKVYAVNNFYSEPEEFCEHGFNGRRWKPGEVDVVVYPTKYGHRRSYKYLGVDINNAKKEK